MCISYCSVFRFLKARQNLLARPLTSSKRLATHFWINRGSQWIPMRQVHLHQSALWLLVEHVLTLKFQALDSKVVAVFFGRKSCPACVRFKPLMQKVKCHIMATVYHRFHLYMFAGLRRNHSCRTCFRNSFCF